uniref:ATP synthase F0 subunit 8 n=1 Tax=Panagrolaimus superbus TaxID=310955 RepID=A0A914Z1Y8_9BILA
MFYVIEMIQLILYMFLAIFAITAFIKISRKLNRVEELQRQRFYHEQNDDIPNLQNITDSEMFPSKNDSIQKGIRLLSGEKVYLNESELAAVLATIQCENERSNLDFRGSVKTRL